MKSEVNTKLPQPVEANLLASQDDRWHCCVLPQTMIPSLLN
jgi:hypothetical protein